MSKILQTPTYISLKKRFRLFGYMDLQLFKFILTTGDTNIDVKQAIPFHEP